MKFIALLLTFGLLACSQHPENSIVKVLNSERTGGGTGFVVKSHDKNVIVTNSHVCAVGNGGQLTIEQEGGKLSTKSIIQRSVIRDLCVLDGVDTPVLRLAKSGPKRFQALTVIGHPFLNPTTRSYGEYVADTIAPIGEMADPDGSCTTGRTEQSLFGAICVLDMELSFTTVPVYPGNSGSPVLNSNGEVIGVINSTGPDNRGLFIPLPYLKEILEK